MSATIDVVDSLDTRKISLASFLDFVELDAPGSLLDADALLLRASRMIDLSTGVLTPEGMSGFAEANFFSTIDLTVDATDIPEPTTILLLGLGLAGLGYTRRRLH